MRTIDEHLFVREEMALLVSPFSFLGFAYVKPLNWLEGEYSAISFNPEEVYRRQDREKDVIGFIHTHPPGASWISGTDIKTMQGWTMSLGIPLYCVIECEGQLLAWRFEGERYGRCSVKRFGRAFILGGY